MFAYCLNSPVNLQDSYGTHCTTTTFSDKDPFASAFLRVGGGGGRIVNGILGIAAVGLVAEAVSTIPNFKTKAKAEAQTATVNNPLHIDYTVYFLCSMEDTSNRIIYVGRTKTSNFGTRMAYHRSVGRVPVFFISGLEYPECRALEQIGMIAFHTLNNGISLYNQINGISSTNRNRFGYYVALLDLLRSDRYTADSMLPAGYWANYIENEMLNGGQ